MCCLSCLKMYKEFLLTCRRCGHVGLRKRFSFECQQYCQWCVILANFVNIPLVSIFYITHSQMEDTDIRIFCEQHLDEVYIFLELQMNKIHSDPTSNIIESININKIEAHSTHINVHVDVSVVPVNNEPRFYRKNSLNTNKYSTYYLSCQD